MDPQGHLSAIRGNVRADAKNTLYTFLQQQVSLSSLMVNWPEVGRLVPAHPSLIKVDSVLGDTPHIIHRLAEGLDGEAFEDHQVFLSATH